MSDSDSPLSDAPPEIPPDARITRALRERVRNAFKNDDFDNLTLKRVRAAVTEELSLPESFLREDAKWKERSKKIVTEEVHTLESSTGAPASSSPAKPAAKPTKPKSPVQKKAAPAPAKPQKRKSPESAKVPQKKRRKKTIEDSDDEEDSGAESDASAPSSEAPSDEEPKPVAPKAAKRAPQKQATKKEAPSSDSQPVKNDDDELGPESELSDLLDDEPAPKRKKQEKSSNPKAKSSAKAQSKPKANSKPDKSLTPHDEEIKRLQGQLVKCGVRKLWGKELKPFDSPKEKIAHLKGMLSDVGMEGRFSEEKARHIKETRELKADLEAIQEGEELWGKKGEEDAPRRRLARGLQELQGLGDDEESD